MQVADDGIVFDRLIGGRWLVRFLRLWFCQCQRHKCLLLLSITSPGVMHQVERTAAANARSRVRVRSRFPPRAAVRCTPEWSWQSHHSPEHLIPFAVSATLGDANDALGNIVID